MANKYNLSHDTTYKVLSSSYLSILDGGGTHCDNCGKLITTIVRIENKEGEKFVVGADCALTLAGINKLDEENIKATVKQCKKFYKELNKDKRNLLLEVRNAYSIFRIVDTDFSGNQIEPFIHIPFVSIDKDNMSNSFKKLVRTIDEIVFAYPKLKDNYYIKKWKEDESNSN